MTETKAKRFTTIRGRYQIVCEICGLVESVAKKNRAIKLMTDHLQKHELSETLSTSVYDLMHKGGGQTIFGGRIHNGVRGWGIGVGELNGATVGEGASR